MENEDKGRVVVSKVVRSGSINETNPQNMCCPSCKTSSIATEMIAIELTFAPPQSNYTAIPGKHKTELM